MSASLEYKGYPLVDVPHPTGLAALLRKRKRQAHVMEYKGSRGNHLHIKDIDSGKNPTVIGRVQDEGRRLHGQWLIQVQDGMPKRILVPSSCIRIG